MTPKQHKIAYPLCLSFFALWLFSILSGFFSSGQWTTTIIFANQYMLALFLGAAILTSISSLMLGLDSFGLSLKPRMPKRNLEKDLFLSTEQTNQTPEISSVNNPTNQNRSKEEVDRLKAFYLFGPNTGFSNCKHKFGYLAVRARYLVDALKTEPIPDECFGCPNLIECVKSARD